MKKSAEAIVTISNEPWEKKNLNTEDSRWRRAELRFRRRNFNCVKIFEAEKKQMETLVKAYEGGVVRKMTWTL
jgi:hypothetical protein